MLRYTTDRARPGLVALYDIRLGNGVGQFLQPLSPHGALGLCGTDSQRNKVCKSNPERYLLSEFNDEQNYLCTVPWGSARLTFAPWSWCSKFRSNICCWRYSTCLQRAIADWDGDVAASSSIIISYIVHQNGTVNKYRLWGKKSSNRVSIMLLTLNSRTFPEPSRTIKIFSRLIFVTRQHVNLQRNSSC